MSMVFARSSQHNHGAHLGKFSTRMQIVGKYLLLWSVYEICEPSKSYLGLFVFVST